MMWFLSGLVFGLLVARGLFAWLDIEPEHERIKKVLAASHDADGLLGIMDSATLEEYNTYGYYSVGSVRLSITVGGVKVVTPMVRTIPELLPHIPRFQAQIAALQEVPK